MCVSIISISFRDLVIDTPHISPEKSDLAHKKVGVALVLHVRFYPGGSFPNT